MNTPIRNDKGLVALVVLVLTLILCLAPAVARADEGPWLDAMVNAVLSVRGDEVTGEAARFEPYLTQLEVVRVALRKGDDTGTYAAMNRFMDMLETRAHGIPALVADWLFDYCYLVTPAKYHDISRHHQKV
jgi:hypothetical protein